MLVIALLSVGGSVKSLGRAFGPILGPTPVRSLGSRPERLLGPVLGCPLGYALDCSLGGTLVCASVRWS